MYKSLPSVVVRCLFQNASLVGYPRFFVSQARVLVVLGVLSRDLCCTVEVCVIILDTLTPVFELYVRLRERRQWDSDFPEFVLVSLGAPARDPRGARHGLAVVCLQAMASRSRHGVPAREGEQRRDEPRREDQGQQQAPAPQGPVIPLPPPVDYGVFMQGLVQAMQTQAHTQAALQAQLEAHRADVWWSSLLHTRFEDGAVAVYWDEFVRLFRAKFFPKHIQDKMEQEFLSLTQGSMTVLEYEGRFSELSKYTPHIVADERRKAKKFVMGLRPSLRTRLVAFVHRTLEAALSAACRQEGEMEQYLEEKKASQKRPAAPFQRQERKKGHTILFMVVSTHPLMVSTMSIIP
ncbi:hypothetical protein Taro_051601 [Colocasia esculenta]|uniref:Retrotransposon gag domain-containing protein n=1 Tax=Colocasia esculenta TaxID=4460 RepID=A0A843XH07_COLES|nr:hypothetical protein [Colocasia esculenta]